MYEETEKELIEALKKLETVKGKEVEGMVRPTTDRAKFEKLLEIIAAIIAALRGVLASANKPGQCEPGKDCPDGSGA